MNRTPRRGRAPRRGAAAAELAVLLPLLAFIFIITFDWSRVFYPAQTIQNAARYGAYLAADPVLREHSPYTSLYDAANLTNYDDIKASIQADCADLDPALDNANIDIQEVTVGTERYMQVTITYDFQTVTSYPGVPTTTTLTRTARMKVAPRTPEG